MDCLFNFCSSIVCLVKSFDVNKTTIKIYRNKKPVSNVLFIIKQDALSDIELERVRTLMTSPGALRKLA